MQKILVETKGNIDESIKILRERGIAKAASKSDRATKKAESIHIFILIAV